MTELMDDEASDVRDLLARALDVDPPLDGLRGHDVATAYRHRTRLRRAALGAATVATSALIVVPFALTGDRGRTAQVNPTTTSLQAATAAGIVNDGDVVQAQGRVVAIPGAAARFCAPVPEALILRPFQILRCSVGVDVTGVDLARLSMRREKDGAVEGYAFLRGVYRHGTLAVFSQGAFRVARPPSPAWTTPPCPTPDGGWTNLGSDIPGQAQIQAYEKAHPGDITNKVLFRPTSRTMVMVLAADHPSAVRQALGKDASWYCVLKSRFSSSQIAAAWQAAGRELAVGRPEHRTASAVWAVEGRTAADGQLSVSISAMMMTPLLRALVDGQPRGLVSIDPWLTRVPSPR